MKENIKYSLFFGAVSTLVLMLGIGNWAGYETLTVPLGLGVFLVMTILNMCVTGLVERGNAKHMEKLREMLEEDEEEEEPKEQQ